MHDPVGPHHPGAQGVADALVAQADAQQRNLRAEPLDHLVRDPRLPGRAGPGEMIRWVGCVGLDLVERDLVVADDPQVEPRVDLAEPLDQVVGERVVVVDQEDHAGFVLGPSSTVLCVTFQLPAHPVGFRWPTNVVDSPKPNPVSGVSLSSSWAPNRAAKDRRSGTNDQY